MVLAVVVGGYAHGARGRLRESHESERKKRNKNYNNNNDANFTPAVYELVTAAATNYALGVWFLVSVITPFVLSWCRPHPSGLSLALAHTHTHALEDAGL